MAAGMELSSVERRLQARILRDANECKLLRPPYFPHELLRMVARHRPFEACRQVIMTLPAHKAPRDFEQLWRRQKLSLTIEAMVLETEWSPHFETAIRDRAKARLDAFSRPPPVI